MLKILSKIGICLLSSYHGAQIFEAIGIGEDVMESAFRGTPSRIGGMSFRDLALEVSEYHATRTLPLPLPLTATATPTPRARWDDDVVFKNQSREPKKEERPRLPHPNPILTRTPKPEP